MMDGMSHRTSACLCRRCIAVAGASPAQVCAADKLLTTARVKPLAEIIEEQIHDGAIVGAQLLVGTRNDVVLERSFGSRGARWQPSGG